MENCAKILKDFVRTHFLEHSFFTHVSNISLEMLENFKNRDILEKKLEEEHIQALSKFILKELPSATVMKSLPNFSLEYRTELFVLKISNVQKLLEAVISKMSIEQFNKIKDGEVL